MHKPPSQKEATPVLSEICRDPLKKRSQILSKIETLDGKAREVAQAAADLHQHDADTFRRVWGGLAK